MDKDEEIYNLKYEISKLNEIISKCAEAVGGFIKPTCSLAFKETLPNEIELTIKNLEKKINWYESNI